MYIFFARKKNKKLLIFMEVYVKMSLLLQDKVLHTMPR